MLPMWIFQVWWDSEVLRATCEVYMTSKKKSFSLWPFMDCRNHIMGMCVSELRTEPTAVNIRYSVQIISALNYFSDIPLCHWLLTNKHLYQSINKVTTEYLVTVWVSKTWFRLELHRSTISFYRSDKHLWCNDPHHACPRQSFTPGS